MDRRGIITADLIFASLIILIIASSIISLASERIDAASTTARLGNSRMIAENVAGAINKVYSGGNGHEVTLSLPANISGKDYEIRVNSSGVFVRTGGWFGKSYINPKRISGGTVSMYGNRVYHIRNDNSSIVISQR